MQNGVRGAMLYGDQRHHTEDRMGVTLNTSDGKRSEIASDAVEQLRSELHGSLLGPGMPGYDEARTIWNAMIDRRPGLIARCADASDVALTVRFARERELLLAVRGGGHN